ncbi:S1C family serine protease [Variovorax ginsengisoli]|uniref:S1C family serine protease n=1 Tax=Variovorax ginsengisoli TaxID=363844 RepID=A0ABT8RXS1_9BURK|nr:S1C family serine protease [Variovorax ginsengisoli]MDN8612123.1 S1C family serine protease [Variovorax ginsengisoli]MDO1531293.1 S1C family serine protease [Variovorax ginsengisoli]
MQNHPFAKRPPAPPRRWCSQWVGVWLAALAWLPLAQAATPAPAVDAARAEAQVQALQRAGDAVVALEVTATEGATSAENLGRQRSGSGVVIGPDGLILTIGYLLLEAETIEVLTQDDRRLPARQVAYDLATGFALVRPLVPLPGIEPVPLAGVGGLRPGEPLLAATGASGGTEVAFTRLVATRPFSGNWEYHIDIALFTSPPIANHSGASLFNRDGELVGIGSLLVREAGGPNRLPGNMFVPVELLRPVLAEMQSTGRTRASVRPWLGLSSFERDGHVQIVRVDRWGPALEAGLQPGDVVLEIDGVRVATLEAFYKQLWTRPDAEADVELTVQQGTQIRKVKVHAVDRMRTLRKPQGI